MKVGGVDGVGLKSVMSLAVSILVKMKNNLKSCQVTQEDTCCKGSNLFLVASLWHSVHRKELK